MELVLNEKLYDWASFILFISVITDGNWNVGKRYFHLFLFVCCIFFCLIKAYGGMAYELKHVLYISLKCHRNRRKWEKERVINIWWYKRGNIYLACLKCDWSDPLQSHRMAENVMLSELRAITSTVINGKLVKCVTSFYCPHLYGHWKETCLLSESCFFLPQFHC